MTNLDPEKVSLIQASIERNKEAKGQKAFTVDTDLFQRFKELTPQKEVDSEELLRLIETFNPELFQKLTDPNQLAVITSLGAGDGAMEFKFIQKILAMRGSQRNLKIHCVDPSPQMKEAFYNNAASLGLLEVVGEYTNSQVEDPTKQLPEGDLVLLSQSLQYIGGWYEPIEGQENTLVKIRQSIKPNGSGAVILQGHWSQMAKIRSDFVRRIGYGDYELDAGWFELKFWETFGEPIIAKFNNDGGENTRYNGFVYSWVHTYLDLSDCFQDGIFNPTLEGEKVLGFIFRRPWQDFSEDMRAKMRETVLDKVEAYREDNDQPAANRIEIVDNFFLFPRNDEEEKQRFFRRVTKNYFPYHTVAAKVRYEELKAQRIAANKK